MLAVAGFGRKSELTLKCSFFENRFRRIERIDVTAAIVIEKRGFIGVRLRG
jgi:hypothetical protein